jgi:hypothetical protein
MRVVNVMQVHLATEYRLAAAPKVVHRERHALELALSLPLAVSVQDFFRATRFVTRHIAWLLKEIRSHRLVSKFTISPANSKALRIGEVSIGDEAHAEVTQKSARSSAVRRARPSPLLVRLGDVQLVTPGSPATYSFRFEPPMDEDRGAAT